MKNLNLIFSIMILGFLLASCDPFEEYYYKVNNPSDFDVTISYRKSNQTDSNSTMVLANSTREFFYDHTIGDGKNPNFLFPIDTIYLKPVNDTFKVIKNINIKSNWEFKVLSHNNSSTAMEYTLKLENKDFERIK